MNVIVLPLKCPFCDGRGKLDTDLYQNTTCTFCLGTGKRPTDAEIERRRQQATAGDKP